MGARDAIAKAMMKGIKAFHSSPHDFDKFDLSKIGTGEGAQVYGHGIYSAENPAVSGQGGQYWNQFANRFRGVEGKAAQTLKQADFDRDAAIALAQKNVAREEEALRAGRYVLDDPTSAMDADQKIWHAALIDKHKEALALLQSGAPVGPRTYELKIKNDPAQMLDWDRRLNVQSPQVQDAAYNMFPHLSALEHPRGENFYDILENKMRRESGKAVGARRASNYLLEQGIPGIKYLDEGSRNLPDKLKLLQQRVDTAPTPVAESIYRGQLQQLQQRTPTSNYVSFDPANDIEILKKYGIAAAPAGTLMGSTYDQLKPFEEPQP